MVEDATGGHDPVEAFDLLANETRLDIVRVLADHRRTNWRHEGLAFADLRRAVGVRDSGTFNHHLDALTGRFVEARENEYVLTESGLLVADAVLAGVYDGTDGRRTAETSRACPACGDPVTAKYENERLALRCPDHGLLTATSLPRGAAEDRSMDELVAVAMLDIRQDVERAVQGVCFHCWGRMTTSIQVVPPFTHPVTGDSVEDPGDGPLAVFGCERCRMVFWSHPFGCVLRHPATIAFAHDHGLDSPPGLEFAASLQRTAETTVASTDPVRVEVAVSADGETLAFTLDEAGDVSDYAQD